MAGQRAKPVCTAALALLVLLGQVAGWGTAAAAVP